MSGLEFFDGYSFQCVLDKFPNLQNPFINKTSTNTKNEKDFNKYYALVEISGNDKFDEIYE